MTALSRRGLLGAAAGTLAAALPALPALADPTRSHRRDSRPDPSGPRPWVPLPPPTGPHPVGTVELRLVDPSRRDPWVPSVPFRELMVSVWYPAAPNHRARAGYMRPAASAHYDQGLARQIPRYTTGVVDFAGTPTHAGLGAPVRPRRGGRPVVLYGPGGGNARTTGTVLVEELASQGYVVVTVDHTYEAAEVEFPDGRLAVDRRPTDATREASALVRVDDTRFVLDTMARLNAGSLLRGALDLDRIGMVGYSAGGYAAAETMLVDRRVRAGCNLDGKLLADDDPVLLGRAARQGLDRPFLQIATPGHDGSTDPSWAAIRANSRGWYRELRLDGSTHLGLSDLQITIPFLAEVFGLTAEEVRYALGTIDPTRAVATVRAYVTAFFDRQLRGAGGNLLDRPSPRYPEMVIVA
ncbi:alpha/beta hydrolase family protein [Micromonospora zhanjiangensis]|uniref:Alpha/beta hydrolase family protein n=1 Tax=Micromonospora zhanjiangensis TaxID=1522057 RepID=A0ABV8KG40_9ACTN